MSNKVDIKNSKISNSNLIVDSPESKTSITQKGTKKDKSWQDNIFLYILISIVIILIGGYLTFKFWGNKMEEKNTKPKINLENSSVEKSNIVVDSPDSVNIVGDSNIVNKLEIPKPRFEAQVLTSNEYVEKVEVFGESFSKVYQTDVILKIISQTQINRLQILVESPNVLGINVRSYPTTRVTFLLGHNAQRGKDFAVTGFDRPYGTYLLSIITTEKENDLISSLKITYE